jgi:uncharacterized protein YkwD
VASSVFLVVFFFAPVVSYSQSVDILYAYKNGVRSCNPSGGIINNTNQAQYEACIASYKYPPANITGRSTLAYTLLSIGAPPFPAQVLVTQGNFSAVVYFRGSNVVAAEQPSFIGGPRPIINPPGVVRILNTSLGWLPYGQLNFTVLLENASDAPILASPDSPGYPAMVYLQFPGYGINFTSGGTTWIGANIIGSCQYPWSPGTVCRVSQLVPNYSLPTNKSFTYFIEVRGAAGEEQFFYRQAFEGQIPPSGTTDSWVSQFIARVNQARGGAKLAENSTLDRFAGVRFATAASQPDISDYGLGSDVASFFGHGAEPTIEEVLLYPQSYPDPAAYASYLQTYAPGHWSALINGNYSQFGYYVGSGPYESVRLPCPVTEIPQAGLNITQFFEQAGCSVSTQKTTWLVIILGN